MFLCNSSCRHKRPEGFNEQNLQIFFKTEVPKIIYSNHISTIYKPCIHRLSIDWWIILFDFLLPILLFDFAPTLQRRRCRSQRGIAVAALVGDATDAWYASLLVPVASVKTGNSAAKKNDVWGVLHLRSTWDGSGMVHIWWYRIWTSMGMFEVPMFEEFSWFHWCSFWDAIGLWMVMGIAVEQCLVQSPVLSMILATKSAGSQLCHLPSRLCIYIYIYI